MNSSLLDLVRELNTLNDDNLADRVIANNDVQWCLSELQDILEAERPTLTPPNEPLTLDELNEMDGVNALWFCDRFRKHKPRLMLVHKAMEGWWSCCDFNGFEIFNTNNYGIDYLLYRRPPEGEEDNQ